MLSSGSLTAGPAALLLIASERIRVSWSVTSAPPPLFMLPLIACRILFITPPAPPWRPTFKSGSDFQLLEATSNASTSLCAATWVSVSPPITISLPAFTPIIEPARGVGIEADDVQEFVLKL